LFTVYCSKCDAENPEDAYYCLKCGAQLKVEEPPIRKVYEKEREEMCFSGPRGSLVGLFFGTLIILVGLVLLLQQYYPWITWGSVWPIFAIALGLIIIIGALTSKRR